MSQFLVCAFALFWLGFCAPTVSAQEKSFKEFELSTCTDKKLGVKFLCGADWELQTDQDAILVVISEDPAVTFTVARTKSPVIYIDQLSHQTLKEIGQYADDFEMKKVQWAGLEGAQVDAAAADYPEIKLRDFYLLREPYLYSFLFSVNPQEDFEKFVPLFAKIMGSVQFIPEEK